MRAWTAIAIGSLLIGIVQVFWVLGYAFSAGFMVWKSSSWHHALSFNAHKAPYFFILSVAFMALGILAARQLRPSAVRTSGLVGVWLMAFGLIIWSGLLLSPLVDVVQP